jgi:hypothetical protein
MDPGDVVCFRATSSSMAGADDALLRPLLSPISTNVHRPTLPQGAESPIRPYGTTADDGDPAALRDEREGTALLAEEQEELDALEEAAEEEDAVGLRASMGVKTVEAAQRVQSPLTRRALYIGCVLRLACMFGLAVTEHCCSLGLAAYMHSLDAITTSSFPAFAASSFHAHSVLGAIQVTQAVVSTCYMLPQEFSTEAELSCCRKASHCKTCRCQFSRPGLFARR